MSSKIYTGACTLGSILASTATPVSNLIEFNSPRFQALHTRAHLPRDLVADKVYTFVVCDIRSEMDDGSDRCAARYDYMYNLVILKQLTTAPADCFGDDFHVQPASINELEALTELSEWLQDQVAGKKQFTDSHSTVNITDTTMAAMPEPDQASSGIWLTDIQVVASVGIV